MNKWAFLFPLVAETHDYAGRAVRGDRRKTATWVAEHRMNKSVRPLAARERFLRRSIEAWRLAAKYGVVPHPGEIPSGAKRLQDVPGWEEAEYPDSALFFDYLERITGDEVRLPRYVETLQCKRTLYDITSLHAPRRKPRGVNARLSIVVALLEPLIDAQLTADDRRYWEKEVRPLLDQLQGLLPEAIDITTGVAN